MLHDLLQRLPDSGVLHLPAYCIFIYPLLSILLPLCVQWLSRSASSPPKALSLYQSSSQRPTSFLKEQNRQTVDKMVIVHHTLLAQTLCSNLSKSYSDITVSETKRWPQLG